MTEDASVPARLFLALWPDSEVVDAISQMRRGWPWPPSAQLVGPQRLHLTLQFIGSVPRERVPELEQGLGVGLDPFMLDLGRVEIWRGGIVVLRPLGVPPALLALRSRLAGALQRLGHAMDEDSFRPHVTLARQAQRVELPASVPRIRWPVAGYTLAESEAGPPARYRALRSWPDGSE